MLKDSCNMLFVKAKRMKMERTTSNVHREIAIIHSPTHIAILGRSHRTLGTAIQRRRLDKQTLHNLPRSAKDLVRIPNSISHQPLVIIPNLRIGKVHERVKVKQQSGVLKVRMKVQEGSVVHLLIVVYGSTFRAELMDACDAFGVVGVFPILIVSMISTIPILIVHDEAMALTVPLRNVIGHLAQVLEQRNTRFITLLHPITLLQ
mmetsp:Transcript_28015/g.52834  ORF Transcript_28015/g.52834 Transcript_28015/m.52834 type:complete len:205 (+) Transcript_28015:3114-3728(+)